MHSNAVTTSKLPPGNEISPEWVRRLTLRTVSGTNNSLPAGYSSTSTAPKLLGEEVNPIISPLSTRFSNWLAMNEEP